MEAAESELPHQDKCYQSRQLEEYLRSPTFITFSEVKNQQFAQVQISQDHHILVQPLDK